MVDVSEKHQRRNMRLMGYDYSKMGAYFVTICIQRKSCLLGEIKDEAMIINDAGRMIERWWSEPANKFPTIELNVSGQPDGSVW